MGCGNGELRGPRSQIPSINVAMSHPASHEDLTIGTDGEPGSRGDGHDPPFPSATTHLPLWRVLLASAAAVLGFSALVPDDMSPGWRYFGVAVSLYGTTLLCWRVAARRRGHTIRDLMGDDLRWKHAPLILRTTLAVVAMGLGLGALVTLSELLPEPSMAAFVPGDAAMMAARVLASAVLAPCAEEILFRGVIFRRLLRHARPAPAAFYSSLLFGLLHLDPFGATAFGMVMVVLYVQTRSLWVPILVHMLNNLITVVGVWSISSSPTTSSLWWLAALLPLSLPWLVRFLRRGLRELTVHPPPS